MKEMQRQIYKWFLDSNIQVIKQYMNISKVRVDDITVSNLCGADHIEVDNIKAFMNLAEVANEDVKCQEESGAYIFSFTYEGVLVMCRAESLEH